MAPRRRMPFNFSIILFSTIFISLMFYYLGRLHDETRSALPNPKAPGWFDVVQREFGDEKINIGLVNMDETTALGTKGKAVKVDFRGVDNATRWSDLYQGWINEEHTQCPKLPMPAFSKYGDLDVVVARVPYNECVGSGGRDVSRLQVNLVVANLLVRCGRRTKDAVGVARPIFAVFVGPCGPMWDLFRCNDLVLHVGDYWVYKPQLWRIEQKLLMPLGNCQPVTPPLAQLTQKELSKQKAREAYATVLHSSNTYVCGAIALAQSIIQSNSTKDLILLADEHISPESIDGLRSAGWSIRRIQGIRNPNSEKNTNIDWNFSKLRLWQLHDYDKVMFVDADIIVTRNLDHLFIYPQMTASWNDGRLFNSGLMLLEPSECTFQTLMDTKLPAKSYKDSEQGFLSDMFPWWHRLPKAVHRLKHFEWSRDPEHPVEDGVYALHYLGMKPWQCYRDYDCNWDQTAYRKFASDSVNRRWWHVYDKMPEKLRRFCALDPGTEARIRGFKNGAERANFSDGHWRIEIKDPRQTQSSR